MVVVCSFSLFCIHDDQFCSCSVIKIIITLMFSNISTGRRCGAIYNVVDRLTSLIVEMIDRQMLLDVKCWVETRVCIVAP